MGTWAYRTSSASFVRTSGGVSQALFDNGWRGIELRSAEKFFAALPEILPSAATLFFQRTSTGTSIQSLLVYKFRHGDSKNTDGNDLAQAKCVSCASDKSFLAQLTLHARDSAEPEICDHFHAMRRPRIHAMVRRI